MRQVTYRKLDGAPFTIEYDPDAACLSCGQPVVSASMGGTAICPWCDCGTHRDGCKWTYEETVQFGERYREAMRAKDPESVLTEEEILRALGAEADEHDIYDARIIERLVLERLAKRFMTDMEIADAQDAKATTVAATEVLAIIRGER